MKLTPLRILTASLVFASLASSHGGIARGTVGLDEALATIRADRIKSDVYFLASDELQGRDSPSNGLRVAARYIRNRLIRLGWRPGAENGYFHEYGLDHIALDWSASSAQIEGGEALRYGRDYFFRSRGLQASDVSGGLVFCGEGRATDFEGVDLEGSWAVCLDSDLHWWRRRENASEAGAVGLLVVPHPESSGTPYAERFAHWVTGMRAGRLRSPGSTSKSLPWMYVTSRVSAQLLPAGVETGQKLAGRFHERRVVQSAPDPVILENVCGFWPGRDPERAKETIVLSAHYDHVGVDGDGAIYNGADDNGTGTAALMAIAEALATHGPLDRSVLLLWVSAEEKGLLGSRAWCQSPWLPGEAQGGDAQVVANINLDMVGRNDPREILLTPSNEHEAYNGLSRIVEKLASTEGFERIGDCDAYWRRSDHMNFSETLGVPVVFLFADIHEDYHKPTDTPDKIDYDKVRRVSRLVLRMLVGLQGMPIEGQAVEASGR